MSEMVLERVADAVVEEKPLSVVSASRLDELKKQILEQFVPHYGSMRYFGDRGVMRMLERWNDKKAELARQLRGHPNWDEESLAVILPHYESREFNGSDACRAFNKMLYAGHIHPGKNLELYKELTKSVGTRTPLAIASLASSVYAASGITQQKAIDMNNRMKELGLKGGFGGGQRVGRVVRKLLMEVGYDEKKKGSEKAFNDFTNAVLARATEVRLLISVHPIDYLGMSIGNSWSSCHAPGGSYFSGTISYMLDSPTAMVYTLSVDDVEKNKDDANCMKGKRTRQVFMFNNGRILQSRLYPQSGNVPAIGEHRKTVVEAYQKALESLGYGESSAITSENRRVRHSNNPGDYEPFVLGSNATLYPDWIHGFRHAYVDLIKRDRRNEFLIQENTRRLDIGATPLCVRCGTTGRFGSSAMICQSCANEITNSRTHRGF